MYGVIVYLHSPPSLSFTTEKFVNEAVHVQNVSLYDGDPLHKRQYLDAHRPVDWIPERNKIKDMREVGRNRDLVRSGRIRYFNCNLFDTRIEEVM